MSEGRAYGCLVEANLHATLVIILQDWINYSFIMSKYNMQTVFEVDEKTKVDLERGKEKHDVEEEEERGHWTKEWEFVISLIGYSVGLSNLWRFPYLALRNGGGAFLIPFFFFLVLGGIPLYYLEVSIGQFSGMSAMFVWKMCPIFQGIGYGMVIASTLCCIYYNAVLAWVIYYLVNSFRSELPWTRCDGWWNTETCVENYNQNLSFSVNISNVTMGKLGKTAAEEYWQYNVLRKSDGLDNIGGIQLHLAGCLLAAWIIVCLCLVKGVKSLGKVVYVTALLPYLLLTIFLIRGLMLDGAVDGIIFYLKPEFHRLASFTVWIEAAVQVFFSLGPAWGGLITMASFNKFNHNIIRDVMLGAMADGLTSFYGGFVIFVVIGHLAKAQDKLVTEVATQGPGLALVAYPETISKLPFPQVWAVMFFVMLLCLGLDSQFATYETVVMGLIDAFPKQLRKRRFLLTIGLAFICYLISLPIATKGGIYVFYLFDNFVSAFVVVMTAIIECLIIGWIYGVDRFCADVELMVGKRPSVVFKVCWTFITPTIMMVAFITTVSKYTLPSYDGYDFPTYANAIGFLISTVSVVPIPIGMAYVLYTRRGTLRQRLRDSIKPAADWGPAAKKYRPLYEAQTAENNAKQHWFMNLVKRSR